MAEDELDAILKTLTQIQIEFVRKRLDASSDKEAAEAIGIAPSTTYGWPNKKDVNRAIQLARLGSLELAREALSRLALKAVTILDEEMDDGKKFAAACEVLDRVGLAAKRELDVTTGGEKLDSGLTDERRIELIAALFDATRARTSGQDTI